MSLIINGNATINKPSTFNSNLRYGNSDILTNDAKSNELVNAEWVRSNYGTAPSPYIHTFTGASTTIPYNKIRGLKWVKLDLLCEGFLCIQPYCVDKFPPYDNCQACKDGEQVPYTAIEKNFQIQIICDTCYYVCRKVISDFSYNQLTGVLNVNILSYCNCYGSQTLHFSKDGKD